MKPEFFGHEGLFDLERRTGLPLRLAFAGIWTVCDREGRFVWRPRTLKREVLPYDDLDFGAVLDALADGGFVHRYSAGGESFGHVPSWTKHQKPHHKEPPSSRAVPTCCDGTAVDDSCMSDASAMDDSSTYSDSDSEPSGSKTKIATRARKPITEQAGTLGELARAYLIDRGVAPTWGKVEAVAVNRWAKEHDDVPVMDLVAAYQRLLRDTFEGFASGSPLLLIKHFDRFRREAATSADPFSRLSAKGQRTAAAMRRVFAEENKGDVIDG